MRVIVTGGGGFVGWHLIDALARRGDVVQAWMRRPSAADWESKVEIVAVDMSDGAAIARRLAAFEPGLIVHLAAQSLPVRSWEEPALTYRVNVIGAINLLEGVRALRSPPRVLLAGSSAEYADAVDGQPIAEDAPTEPNSPYGASKLAADQLARLYVRRYGLDLVRFRPFFLVGPRKTGDVCSDFARRIVAIERGLEHGMRVGLLDVVRDIIDVRDGVGGILRLAEAGRCGELYNISGGSGVSIGQILDVYRRLASVPLTVVEDPSLMRPLEQKVRTGDSRKLRALGWAQEYSLFDTLRSILDYWRQTSSSKLASPNDASLDIRSASPTDCSVRP
jgi:nucleoside-diphosphate-sugar epimerase